MKKRIGIIVALLCALSMTACGGRKAAEPDGAQFQEQAAETAASSAIVENAASGGAESDMGKTKDSAETAGEKVATVERQLLDAGRIPVQVESHFQEVPGEEEDGVDILSQVKYQKLQLTEEASGLYPELEQALEAYSDRQETEMKSALGTLAGGAREGLQQGWMNREFYIPFFSESETEVLRADRRVFSFCTQTGEYAGGAHPNSSFYAQTLDPLTGEEISLSQVLTDTQGLSETIFAEMKETEEERAEVIGDEQLAGIRGIVQGGLLTFGLSEEGLHAYFSPYAIGPYALGAFDVLLPYSKYPELFREEYLPERMRGLLSDAVAYSENDPLQYTPDEAEMFVIEEDPDNYETLIIENPDQKGEDFGEEEETDSAETPQETEEADAPEDAEEAELPGVLTEVSHDTVGGVLDAQVWAEENSTPLPPHLPYTDGTYCYRDYGDGSYGYIALEVEEKKDGGLTKYYDLSAFSEDPEAAANRKSLTGQRVIYATAEDGILYVALGHASYASYAPNTGYILAIDMQDGTLLWKSRRQVSNANNFVLRGDYIICGYGFTSEPDFIYILDKESGKVLEQIDLPNAPYHFLTDGDELTVLTYNSVYRYTMKE